MLALLFILIHGIMNSYKQIKEKYGVILQGL
jgi:hypothetical protein